MVARLAGKFDGLDSFGDGADLVQLDENGVGDAFLDAAGQALGARDEEVVADKLDFLFGGLAAEALGQGFPAGPVVLGHAILDGNDGVLFHPVRPVRDHLHGRVYGLVRLLENVVGFVVELAGGWIESDAHLLAWFVTGGSDGLQNDLNRLFVRFAARGKAALDRKSTRLNSSHSQISYAVFCLKKKKPEARRHMRKKNRRLVGEMLIAI